MSSHDWVPTDEYEECSEDGCDVIMFTRDAKYLTTETPEDVDGDWYCDTHK